MTEPKKITAEITESSLLDLGFSDPKRVIANGNRITELSENFDITAIINDCANSPMEDEALNYLERILSSLDGELIVKFSKETKALKKLITLCGSSPYLSEILIKNSLTTTSGESYIEELFFGGLLEIKKDVQAFVKDLKILIEKLEKADELNETTVMNILRRYKNIEYVRIGMRDLLKTASMEEITEEISDIAEASIEVALKFILQDLKKSFGAPLIQDPVTEELTNQEAGFTVLAMGKFGGRELNFSSDIDIVYLYETSLGESEGVENKPNSKINLHNYFTKVGNMLTKIIGANTADGMVFRVDLDLRPEGHTGNVVNSLRAMETYYEAWGRSWERAAMIKVRAVGGDAKLGKDFLDMITPFSFRKYLDYTNIEEIRVMKEQIDISLKQKKGSAVDIKLGRGGIREIEFFCQANQLVRGGKNKNLRTKKTLDTLKALYKDNVISKNAADTLTDCYIYLRNLEHRIQIVQGRQSQTIPAKKEELIRLAKMTGIKSKGNGDDIDCLFWEEYKKYTDKVYAIYETLFYSGKEELKESTDKSYEAFVNKNATAQDFEKLLKEKNIGEVENLAKDLILLRDGSPNLRLSHKALSSREDLLPVIIQKTLESASPQKAIKHIERFFTATGNRINIYSMLKENLDLLNILIVILSESTYLANVLISSPQNIDTLLSSEKGKQSKTLQELKEELDILVKNCGDNYEEILGAVRNFKNEEFFRIGISDLSMVNDFTKTSLEISNVADTLLDKAIHIAEKELEKTFGDPPSKDFFILALGKYGSSELTYGSDLDIVFVFDAPIDAVTNGQKPVTPLQYFTRLAQKIINLLSTNTKEGIAFKVDAELRPSGSSGPLVTTRNSLIGYQKDKAQFWERQSMTRLRVCAGNTAFGEEVKKELLDIIFSKTVTDDDLKEVLRLRQRMVEEIAKEKPNDNETFDLKTGTGAMTDIEFVIQVLTLKTGLNEEKPYSPYTMESLKNLEENNMLSKEDAVILKDSFDFYKKLLSRLRIEHDKPEGKIFCDSPELKSLALVSGSTSTDEFLKKLIDTKKTVRELFLKYLK